MKTLPAERNHFAENFLLLEHSQTETLAPQPCYKMMNILRLKSILFICTGWLIPNFAFASTIGIATGSKTADGRPLLFKTRDRTDAYPADVSYFPGAINAFAYVYHHNAGQAHNRVRMGVNERGFGVVFSDSENLEGAGTGPSGSQLAAIALKICETVQDFRDLLDDTNGARNAHNHYGVIDANGEGALFEVSGFSYFELPVIDSVATMANTAKFHPDAGPPAGGSTSPDREARAAYLLNNGPAAGLDYRYFVKDIMQDFSRSQEDEDAMPVGQYFTNPVLSRYKTASGCVIRGAKPGDDPLIESIMWLAMSEPSLTVTLPFPVIVDQVFDFVKPSAPDDGLPGTSDRVRQLIYDYTNGRYADRYADTFVLIDIREGAFPIEDSLFNSFDEQIITWRTLPQDSAKARMIEWAAATQFWAKQQYDSLYQRFVTGIEPASDHSIAGYRLFANYPNPFNSSTTIAFELPRSAPVSLEIYNISGKVMWRISKKQLSAGHHLISFDGNDLRGKPLPGGIYFYRLTAGIFSQTHKMVILP